MRETETSTKSVSCGVYFTFLFIYLKLLLSYVAHSFLLLFLNTLQHYDIRHWIQIWIFFMRNRHATEFLEMDMKEEKKKINLNISSRWQRKLLRSEKWWQNFFSPLLFCAHHAMPNIAWLVIFQVFDFFIIAHNENRVSKLFPLLLLLSLLVKSTKVEEFLIENWARECKRRKRMK